MKTDRAFESYINLVTMVAEGIQEDPTFDPYVFEDRYVVVPCTIDFGWFSILCNITCSGYACERQDQAQWSTSDNSR